ncbi:M28 family metallopeptidase [Elizabethkingia meningoseptica]|uniref:M28 family metallopeptidase n=1 Tax=Elizabethkingia meningoseptica TaxID=238 RepID=UPI000936981B|nr:M28 family metallopeptidase [Elizabethkingia meningoseptica]MDE5487870.1 M28 family metallopeptidase [Elizabethkingia meningoseptica]MVW90910.1 M28 family peptidase [Elizabethkingia meningoseptica]
MKKLIFSIFFIPVVFSAQQVVAKDAEISGYVSQVSSDSLKAHINKLISFGTRHTMSSTTDPKRGIGAARNWVLKKFRDYAKNTDGRMEVFLQNQTIQPDGKRINQPTDLGNAVAILHGTDPNDKRIFMISGHLDSRVTDVMNAKDFAPGANDDGSGTSAVIESARVLSRSKFPASIIFVTFSGEEQGLLGSKMLAEKAKNEKWQLEALLNNDMISNNLSSGTNLINAHQLRVFSEGLPLYDLDKKARNIRNMGLENDGEARQLARYIKETGERYVDNLQVKLIYRNDRFLRGGDHSPFVENGFPAVRLTEFNENFDHQHQDIRKENGKQYGDLPEFMDFDYFRKNVGVNVSVLANLAKSPSKPENVKMEVKGLTNFTSLSWEKPKNGEVSGYYILMRETDSPVWQKKFFTKKAAIKLPYSKDNYFFAVQAVNSTGNESLIVIPGV